MDSVTIKKLIEYYNKPNIFISKIFQKTLFFLPDKLFLSILYKLSFNKKLNWENPKTFNEKLQWLKLFDRRPLYTSFVDKYRVREFIAETIGEEYLIPLLGVWNSPEEINFDKLPNQFVLKCNHNSGGICICKDKSEFDIKRAKKLLRKWMNSNFWLHHREYPYKNIHKRIIAEKYMEDFETKELKDYKFFCFDGIAKAMFIASDRQKVKEEIKFDFFDMNFNFLNFTNGHPNSSVLPKKPKNFELMKELAEKLSKGIPQIRIDFYEINGKVYFGEMTLFHLAGFMPFKPNKWDYIFGSWIKLPRCKQ